MFFAPLPSDPSYLDPVSSGAIVQILLAVFLAISLLARAFWRNINLFFAKLKRKFTNQEENPSALGTEKNTDNQQ
jgi:hypothetical protein